MPMTCVALLGGLLLWFLTLAMLSLIRYIIGGESVIITLLIHVIAIGAGIFGYFVTREICEARRRRKT